MTGKSQEKAADIVALLRARNPLVWVVTTEEVRVERYLMEAAAQAGYIPRTWDVGQGTCDMAGNIIEPAIGSPDPGDILRAIGERARGKTLDDRPLPAERGVWIMRDMPAWLVPPIGITTQRQLRNLARMLPITPRDRAQAIIVITPSSEIPPELAGHATLIDWPRPDRGEIAAILDSAIDALPDDLKEGAAPNGTRDAAIDAAVGLSGEEAQACYARSLVQLKKIDPLLVAKEKKRVVAREGVLEWFDPLPGGLDAVGGLENLKAWLTARKVAFTPEAREFGLPPPKGALVIGISGTGKSLISKATATAWGVPLLRMDLGALKAKYVGESEANLRKAFNVIEAIGRCVVWLDEVEKALAGATQGAADGGVSADALGAILNWMQERQGSAFIIATANSAADLPPEFTRAGRFDALWFVDLPTREERIAIIKAALVANNRRDVKIDLDKVATATNGFTGAEIASIVPDAMFAAFAEKAREITTADLITAAKAVVPLATTAQEKIAALKKWAAGRARPASKPETAKPADRAGVRELDVA